MHIAWLWIATFVMLPPVSAGVFTVVNTNAAGPGSLRQAITDADASEDDSKLIIFSIPGSGPHKIDVSGNPLPTVTSSVTIDGYTQPGARPNTLQTGNNAIILIQIDGGGPAATTRTGLFLMGDCTIRGLSLTGFARPLSGAAIVIDPGDFPIAIGGNRIEGNFIGVAPDGVSVMGNYYGVRVRNAGGNTVGGGTLRSDEAVDPQTRNVISGNEIGVSMITLSNLVAGNYIGWDPSGLKQGFGNRIGIDMGAGIFNRIGGFAAGAGNLIGNNTVGIQAVNGETRIQGNVIGPRADGGAGFGNQTGIEVSGRGIMVGGLAAEEGNVIAFNRTGIAVLPASFGSTVGNRILSNLMYANVADIDLAGDGFTPNDPGDPDTGPNLLQNFPVVAEVKRSATSTTVVGGLNSKASTSFTLQFFATKRGTNPGQVLLGTETISTDSAGNARFEFSFPIPTAPDEFVTDSATDPDGNTSELFPPNAQGELANISTRGFVGTGEDVLIGGFIRGSGLAARC
ncbi:MAG TPA: hypothetical protein VK993_06540 [Chthoniobacterales bacterium]|nr:hypothetical protein [Chthoniobacterales bacterium]